MGATAPSRPRLVIRRAVPDDLDAIWSIEQVSFPTPWSRNLLRSELHQTQSLYLAATVEGQLIGYVGMWNAADEGHICTLAVAPQWRGRGVGEALMLCALRQAAELGAGVVQLEYRVSNHAAGRLYQKLGFQIVGRRPGYYRDTGEDAVVAAIFGLQHPATRSSLEQALQLWPQEREIELVLDL